jgi:hypothetical protein
MADKEFAPLSTACARALNDRIYEKRKTAALEIEKMVRNLGVSLLKSIYFGKILELAYLVHVLDRVRLISLDRTFQGT